MGLTKYIKQHFMTKPVGITQNSLPMLVSIHNPRHDGVGICARADDEEDNQEERLEIEQRRLVYPINCISICILTLFRWEIPGVSEADWWLQVIDGLKRLIH